MSKYEQYKDQYISKYDILTALWEQQKIMGTAEIWECAGFKRESKGNINNYGFPLYQTGGEQE